jgi:hypothetical protein
LRDPLPPTSRLRSDRTVLAGIAHRAHDAQAVLVADLGEVLAEAQRGVSNGVVLAGGVELVQLVLLSEWQS